MEICERDPLLKKYGLYRKLNDGTYEYMPYCNPKAAEWVSMWGEDFNNLMDTYLPKPKVGKP